MENRNLLVVDDEPQVLHSLGRELRPHGYTIFMAGSAREGLEIIRSEDVGVVLSDMKMPVTDGISFLETVARISSDTVRILLTGYANLDSAIKAVNRSHIFGFLTKPWEAQGLYDILHNAFTHTNLIRENRRLQELTSRQNAELTFINENLEKVVAERTDQLQEAVREGIEMLALAAEAKDDVTGDHIYRIKHLTGLICLKLGMAAQEADEISFFSMIHDIGKIRVPDHILKKEGPLTEAEWRIMKEHTTAGEKILGNKPFYRTARLIARSHHERWDGSGYPDGLAGPDIPLAARIVAVADVYDALTSPRPYKKAWPTDRVLALMRSQAGTHFDPEILEALLALHVTSH